MRLWLTAFLLAAAMNLIASFLPAAEPEEGGRVAKMQEVAARYLNAKDDAARQQAGRELDGFRNVTREEFAAVVLWLKARQAASYKPLKSGTHERRATFRLMPLAKNPDEVERGVQLPFRVHLPRDYDPKKSYPCMIYVGGLSGATAFKGTRPDWIGLGITVKAPYRRDRGLTIINCPLEHALREFHIDPDRIYMGGFSAGGAYTFVEACANPDFYAGIMPCSSHSANATLFNLRNIGIYLLHGERDANVPNGKRIKLGADSSGTPCELRIIPNTGHNACQGHWKEAAAWLAEHPRPTYPKAVRFRQYWWTDREGPRAGWHRHFWTYTYRRRGNPSKAIRMAGRLREQAVEVELEGIDGLELYLCDEMVNLDKPVRLVVNGQSSSRKFERSLLTLLDYHREEPYAGLFFASKITVGQTRGGAKSLDPIAEVDARRFEALAMPALDKKPPAAEGGPPLVRLNDLPAAAVLTGWVYCQNMDGVNVQSFGEVPVRNPQHNPGFVELRAREDPNTKRGVKEEVAALQRLNEGDHVEVHYRLDGWRLVVTAYRRLSAFPQQGKIVGVNMGGAHPLKLRVTRPPRGGEHLVGQEVDFWARIVRNRRERSYGPDPGAMRLMKQMKRGHLVEVNYKVENLILLIGARDLGPAPEEDLRLAEPKKKPAQPEKKPGEPGKGPGEKPGDPEGDPNEKPVDDLDEF